MRLLDENKRRNGATRSGRYRKARIQRGAASDGGATKRANRLWWGNAVQTSTHSRASPSY